MEDQAGNLYTSLKMNLRETVRENLRKKVAENRVMWGYFDFSGVEGTVSAVT